MLIRIDPSAAAPLYEQVATQVRTALRAGTLAVDDRLPPARQLATSLGINIHTVLRAYAELRDDGLIELRRGRGAVVISAPPPPHPDVLAAVRQLLDVAARHGLSSDALHLAIDQGA